MYSNFNSYISNLEASSFYIILHHNADPDALCAAEVFGSLITLLNSESDFSIYSDDINSSGTRIMDEMNIIVHQEIPKLNPDKNNVIITVDTANLSQLGKYQNWVTNTQLPLLVVDHHDTSEMATGAIASIVDPETSSTCILAAKAYLDVDITPSPRIATLIMAGHLYDSRRLLYGSTSKVFDIFSYLIESGGDYEKANLLLQNDMSHGEKIARFKASQRMRYHVLPGKVIVITSRIGAFEASAARSFIGAGADVSLVIAPKNDELRGSARARSYLGLNIGDVMSELAEEFNGSGGGHAAAAGFNIVPTPSKKTQNNLLSRFVEITKNKLNPKTS